jgi:hypothetical protein
MNFQSRDALRKRAGRRGDIRIEALERRALLAASTESFNLPPLQHLIIQAREGIDTAPAAINVVVTALASQLLSGPLADLQSGTVDGNGFVTEVQSMEASYDTAIHQALIPEFPNVYTLLVLQGQRIVANESALNQQHTVGLLSDSDFPTEAAIAINALTNGPLFSLHTPLTGYAVATQGFEASLSNIADGLTASAPLTPAKASLTMLADTVAYQADIHAALQVTHPGVSNTVDMAVASLLTTADAVATESASDAAMLINTAISAFNAAILDTTGVFGSKGPIAVAIATRHGFPPHTKDHRPLSFFTSVSGTASLGGTATLTATLFSANGQAIAGVPVSFTLDGAFAGVANTNSSGIATLPGVTTSDAVGTDTGGVFAFYAGNINAKSTTGTGDLTVSQANTTLTSVSGTATFGGTATLTATLMSAVTGKPISGQTVTFTLDGTPVSTPGVTNSEGVATVTGVTTTDDAGTHVGVVVANFAGDSDFNKSTGTGNLTVSKANTTLGSVSGSAAFGGTASFTATLTSSVTHSGVANETVTFLLNGTSVGTAKTNSNGVATLTGITNTQNAGTYPNAVEATFSGDSNYNAAANATGTYTVTAAGTTVTAVSGSAAFGGTATLTATLTSSVTHAGVSGQTISFSLDGGTPVTSATNSSGVATVSGIPTSDPVGTDPGGVVATFTAPTGSNYTSSSGTGDFTVNQADVTFSSVAGTATGGMATLTATLTSAANGSALSGFEVDFSLDGTSIGPATTDSNGVAKLTGVPTSDATGTYPNAVSVAYAGNTDYKAGSAKGTLIVS